MSLSNFTSHIQVQETHQEMR